MKKFLSTFSLLSLFLPFMEVVNAEDYKYFKTNASIISNVPTVKLYGVTTFGNETLLDTWQSSRSGITLFTSSLEDAMVDQYEGKLLFEVNENDGTTNHEGVLEYDLINKTLSKVDTSGNVDLDDYALYPEAINKMISEKADGSIHIGDNSAVFKEENGREKFWAQDANGKAIPIDITNGSKLLINGRDVEQSINNVGALSAALTGLPTVPTDTTLACGLGTGTHGGDFAFSGGCASKVNDKLSINYAASMTMPGQDYAGDFEDTFSARAGFVWKLGKATKPTQISMKDKKVMETKIESLEKKNKTILSKNQKLENKLSILMARLEKIEKIALGESKSKDLAVYKLQ